mmetsp:Transcript_34523/g.72651  ORF Transcript_34523/g.72651 Transcript_34523/m.72651 type:complete len:214 (-) Transcript_34523:733-1374(-)|eukprot:4146674-Pleurochrysis_carterae.AAC.3
MKARNHVLGESGDTALLEHILSLTDAKTVAASITTCKFWAVAALSDALWQDFCEQLWHEKVYVRHAPGVRAFKAFWQSFNDSLRSSITADELTSFAWSFRFRTDHRTLHGLSAGAVAQAKFTAGEEAWKGHFSSGVGGAPSSVRPLRWWLVMQGGQEAVECTSSSTVRVSPYPPLTVQRTPKWGWVLANQFVELSSHEEVEFHNGENSSVLPA